MSRRGRIELTEADREGLAAGTISMVELAARFGVTRAALSLYCKRHGIKHSLRPGAGVRAKLDESARLLPQLTAVQDHAEREKLLTGFRDAMLLNLYDQTSRIAADGNLGPKALRDTVAAANELESRLIAIGLLPAGNQGNMPSVLRIEVMGQDEAERIQAEAEADMATLYGNARHTDADSDSDEQEKPPVLDLGAAINAATSAEVIDLGPVRHRLKAVQARQGNAGLRALALKLGIDGVPRSNPEQVVTLILRRLREQPGLIEKIAA